MKILVCGGAGYIGSHAVYELIDNNYEVIVFDNLEKGHKKAIHEKAKFIKGDLRNYNEIENVFKNEKIDAVINFASYILVGESCNEPIKYFENNVVGTLNLLKAMNEYNVKYIVFSSTAATYGDNINSPLLETEIPNPLNPYGESKLCVEKMLKWIDSAHGIKYVILRYFNVAGAHISGNIGEDHNPETHLIPIVLSVALGKREKVTVFGDDYNTPDGTCIRDYIHVTDLVNAHIEALKKLISTNESTLYNLGNGTGFSVKEIIEAAKKITGIDIPYDIGTRRAGDPATLVASSKKIISETNYMPKYASLNKIIETDWHWHKSHPDGFNG